MYSFSRNGEKRPCCQLANKPSRKPRSRRAPHAVVSADPEGIIRDWNETAEHIFGHSAGQAIGRTLDLIVPEEERADHWRNFRRVMATGVLNYRPDHVLDIEGLRRDGTRVTLDAALIAIHDEVGGLVGITAIIRETD